MKPAKRGNQQERDDLGKNRILERRFALLRSSIGLTGGNRNSRFTERRANVHENKGPLWKDYGRSGNVIENKGSYANFAGMSLKTQ
jgi:hypothetical protein